MEDLKKPLIGFLNKPVSQAKKKNRIARKSAEKKNYQAYKENKFLTKSQKLHQNGNFVISNIELIFLLTKSQNLNKRGIMVFPP